MTRKIIGCLCWSAQVLICCAAVVSFVILAVGGENMLPWIPALLLSIYLIYYGIHQILILWKGKKDDE